MTKYEVQAPDYEDEWHDINACDAETAAVVYAHALYRDSDLEWTEGTIWIRTGMTSYVAFNITSEPHLHFSATKQ